MKHGRPERGWYEFCGKSYHLTKNSEALGWRREHAHRVWQAMQAVLACVALIEHLDWSPDVDPRQMYQNAGWYFPVKPSYL